MKQFFLILILAGSFVSLAQQNDNSKQAKSDSLKKFQLIYTNNTRMFSSSKTGGSASGISIDFRVGEDGIIKNIGRRGKNLAAILKNDPEAYSELRRAYKVHLRKKRICNVLEYSCYALILGSAIILFVGADNYESDGVTAPLVGGGIGVAASFTGILVFKNLTDKHMNNFARSINRSIEIYNENLLKTVK